MHRSAATTATLLLAAALFASCSSDDDQPVNPGGTPSSGFTFKVDGTSVTVDSARAVLYTLGIPPNNREVDVFAYAGGQEVLEFHFLPRTGTQTAAQNFNEAWLTYESHGTNYHSQSGQLVLTTCDTTAGRFEGTFQFVGQSGTTTHTITEGRLLVTRMTRQ